MFTIISIKDFPLQGSSAQDSARPHPRPVIDTMLPVAKRNYEISIGAAELWSTLKAIAGSHKGCIPQHPS